MNLFIATQYESLEEFADSVKKFINFLEYKIVFSYKMATENSKSFQERYFWMNQGTALAEPLAKAYLNYVLIQDELANKKNNTKKRVTLKKKWKELADQAFMINENIVIDSPEVVYDINVFDFALRETRIYSKIINYGEQSFALTEILRNDFKRRIRS
jgi:hypothetical protein